MRQIVADHCTRSQLIFVLSNLWPFNGHGKTVFNQLSPTRTSHWLLMNFPDHDHVRKGGGHCTGQLTVDTLARLVAQIH